MYEFSLNGNLCLPRGTGYQHFTTVCKAVKSWRHNNETNTKLTFDEAVRSHHNSHLKIIADNLKMTMKLNESLPLIILIVID